MAEGISPRSLRLRNKEVAAILGCGRSTIWRWVKERPGFPQPRREGTRCTYWLAEEVERYAREANAEQVTE